MEHKDAFSVVIPAYNETDSIEQTIADIQRLAAGVEIIIVDDASSDDTYERARNMGVKVIRHRVNRGYGAALKTGIRQAQYDKIVITDADGTYPNDKIPELLQVFDDEHADMVVGARIGQHVKIPLIRRPAKWFINKLASFLVGMTIPDVNSGLRVMRKTVVERYMHLLPDGFSFTTTITLALLSNAHVVTYLPIDYFKRTGKSKIRPIQDTLNFIQLIIRTILYFNPLKIFLPLSLPLILGGLLLIMFQAIYKHNISTISVIISLAGIQLLAIGMLADLIDKRNP